MLLFLLFNTSDCIFPESLQRNNDLVMSSVKLKGKSNREKDDVMSSMVTVELFHLFTMLSLSSSMAEMSFPNCFKLSAMTCSSSVCVDPMHSKLNSFKLFASVLWHRDRSVKIRGMSHAYVSKTAKLVDDLSTGRHYIHKHCSIAISMDIYNNAATSVFPLFTLSVHNTSS